MEIKINNKRFNLLDRLPTDIESLSVKYNTLIVMPINRSQSVLIKKWLNNIVDRLTCDYVLVNNTLVNKKDINKFKL